MKIVTIITAALISLAVSAAQQATIPYCDNNREQAVKEAFSQIDYVLPDKISDYMREHAIPTFVTNKETIVIQTNYVTNTDHFETNYTYELITNDVTYNIHSNTYFSAYISTNYIDATGFTISPDGTKAISGDLRMYNVSLSPVKKVIDGFSTYSTIIDESTGLHYVPMSVYKPSAVYIRYQCVENPLEITGSGSYTRYKAGLNVVVQASGVKSRIDLYNDNGSSVGQTDFQLIEDIDSGKVKWSFGDHVFSFSDRIYTFTPNGDSVLTSNDVERIIEDRVPPPVPADRIYDSTNSNWSQYLKGDLKIYDSQDNVIGEVATKKYVSDSIEEQDRSFKKVLSDFNPNRIMSRDGVSYISGDLTVFTGIVALVITNGVPARYIKSDDGMIYEWDQNNTDGALQTTGGYNVYKNLNYPNDEFYSRNLDYSHQSDYPHYEHGLTWYVDVNNNYREYMIFSSSTDYVKTRVSESNANEVRFDTGSELFFIDAEVDKANTHYWEHSAVATVRNGGMTFNPTGFSSNMVAYVSINQRDTSQPDTNPAYTYGARTLKIIGDDVLETGNDEDGNEYIDYGFSGGSVRMFTRENFKLRYFPRTGRWTIVSRNTNIKVVALVDGKSDSIYFFPNYVKIQATRTSTSAYDQVYELFLYRWLSTGIEYK